MTDERASVFQSLDLIALNALVTACEEAFAGLDMASFEDDADVSHPPSGITFGMIRRARAALTLHGVERDA